MTYRLLAVDLDGTIMDENLSVSVRVRRALRLAQEAGVKVTLASGRPSHQTLTMARELGIREPLISYQGAVIVEPDSGLVMWHRGVQRELALDFVRYVRSRGWDLCIFVDGKLYAESTSESVRFYAGFSPSREKIHVVERLESLLDTEPTKLIVVVEERLGAQVALELQQHFEGRLQVVQSFSRFVEATDLEATKGKALALLAEKLGIPQQQTMAIGDQDNDASMLAWAGLGVAMGSASASVKSLANYIAPEITDDGAAVAIERFILGVGSD